MAAPEVREELERLTLSFAERAGMDGMGSMEYKWDDNHSKFVMIEPTVGRTDWPEEIATLCGVNIPLAAYRYELGLSVDPVSVSRTDIAWRSTLVDKPPQHLRHGVARIVDGYFRWDDPWPALKFYCFDHPVQRILRRWRRTQAFERSEAGVERRVKCP